MSVTEIDTRRERGVGALLVGDWEAARDAFVAIVEVSDDPEALDGLGRSLWWLGDPRGAVVHRERAYAGFRRLGEPARAARIALWLSREYALVWGNAAAARGWLARAERLLSTTRASSLGIGCLCDNQRTLRRFSASARFGPERDAAAAAVGSRTMKGAQKPKKTGKKAPQKTMKERKIEKRAAAKNARTMDV